MTPPSYILDEEEQEILDSIERGEWKKVENFEEIKKDMEESARLHLKRQPITIRIQNPLLWKIKAQAAKKGIPYQTYIQSVLFEHFENTESLK